MPEPFLIVIAGPNGSGKTTLTNLLRRSGLEFGEYINPDETALRLQGSYEARVREAQALADSEREACLDNMRSFSFETVMSHPSKVEIMQAARERGFRAGLYYVGTSNPRINVRRVANRVAMGGHDVPEDRIVARYVRTMELLPLAIRAAHRSLLFDNSVRDGDGLGSIELVAEVENMSGNPRTIWTAEGPRFKSQDCDWIWDALAKVV